MAARVKRRYESPQRRAQAEATRRQILGAAQRLFERQGYAATTIAAIANEAGVAPKTVHLAFETKAGVLRALWHLLLRGDQDEVPIGERAWYRRLLDEPDPERMLAAVAAQSRAVKERAGALMAVIRNAAAVDDTIAALWARIQTDFHGVQRGIVEALATRGALRADLHVDTAADILWTLNHPDVWHLLAGERGWTPEAWERWFLAGVRQQLLGRP
jgi:AcrR family transcriptional regulator